MGFRIIVQNDGEDGTIEVNERLNLNETIQVFRGVIQAGGRQPVDCQGDAPKDFTWVHRATNLGGGPESKKDGEVLRVSS